MNVSRAVQYQCNRIDCQACIDARVEGIRCNDVVAHLRFVAILATNVATRDVAEDALEALGY